MVFLRPSLLSYHQLSPYQGSIPVGEPLDRHLPTLFPLLPIVPGGHCGDAGDPTVSLFQEEASRLKQDASALLVLVDTSLAQYQGLQSRMGHWEEEAKQLLRGQEGERAVRGWLARGHPQQELQPWGDACGPSTVLARLSEAALPAWCRIGPFLGAGLQTSVCAGSCWCRVSPAHLLHVRQVEDLLLQGLELR